ncbi:PrpR N-terminal domain-containing protein [Clostridium sp. SYSU_GA19001]|uniref:sigma-54-dependent Fis family transcriptional regulator n=1 Tax=Clostridium caldaquaticum TaxID=2940653 RepID=UPI002076E3AF|nr:sigma-54-dependent transcriptional regulator [Clostridium caldaquaticum]MCM8711696.1 PrpR N-terminal domain-containing protein [Clostridium caldaquaticum]
MKVMVIAPYNGLKELIINMKENVDFDLQVEVGDMEKGVALAREALTNGTDIIISRGGTAELIQKEVSIPVVEVEISGYDMLRVLTLLKDYPGKTAIVGFASISESAATVCEILNADIYTYTIQKEDQVEEILIKLKQEGYNVIIGDVITVREAERMGLNGVLLTSGRESVLKAFQNAKKIYAYTKKLKMEFLVAHNIIQNEKAGIVAYNQRLQPVYSNLFYQENLDNLRDKLNLEHLVKEVFQKGEFQTLIFIENEYWKITGCLLENNSELAVFRIERGRLNNEKDIPGVFIISPDENLSVNITNLMISKNEKMKYALEMAEKYSRIEDSIWITGEKGTGKEKLAQYIHFNSSKRQYPLVVFHCDIITEESWSDLLNENGDKAIISSAEIGMVFFKNIDALSVSVQKQLIDYLLKSKLNCRLIASSGHNILSLIEQGKFLHELYYYMSHLALELPSLNERKEDVESLARIYINDFNVKFGKQIVGIREGAIELLKNFKWQGNLNQFKEVIGEIMLVANNTYIEYDDVEKVLKRIKMPIDKETIDLSGTLEEIEQRIIKKVWLEEGMNNTRTAERLNINRTTLWRKLK